MRSNFKNQAKAIPIHPYEWLWEPLLSDSSFHLVSNFGGRSLLLDGKLMLFFIAKDDPWRGVLICTDRSCHESLTQDFPMLTPHPTLGKWLYLPEVIEDFENIAKQLAALTTKRDPRIGVESKPKKKKA